MQNIQKFMIDIWGTYFTDLSIKPRLNLITMGIYWWNWFNVETEIQFIVIGY